VVKIRRRIELLEQALLPEPRGPDQVFHVHFVDAERKVVSTLELKMGQVRRSNDRRWSRGRPRG
jgi:hypothetical protein